MTVPADGSAVEEADEGALEDRRARQAGWMFFGLLGAGLVLRIALARSVWMQPDGDEAAGIVMAYRAAHGNLALVFEGGNYGGTLSSWIEAPFVAVFGPRWWIFWAFNTAMALGSCFVLRAIGRRMLTPVAAAVAGGTFFLFPPLWVFWSSKEYEFWNPAMLLALSVALLTFHWFERRSTKTLYALGFVAGLAVWSYPLIASLVLPPVAIFIWAERRHLDRLLRAGLAALVGLLPWIMFIALHGRDALDQQAVADPRTKLFQQSISRALPVALLSGQERVADFWVIDPYRQRLFGLLGVTTYVVALGCLAYFVARRNVAMAACCASVGLWPVVLTLGHVPVTEATGRYGLIAVPPLLLLGAYLLSLARLSALLAVVAVLYSFAVTGSNTETFASAPVCSPGIVAVGDHLESKQREAVWGSYWLAGILTYCSEGRISVASATPPTRDGTAEDEARRAPASTFVVYAGNVLDQDIARFAESRGMKAVRTELGGYAVWTFPGRVTAEEIASGSAF
jgi:hypothetical protein